MYLQCVLFLTPAQQSGAFPLNFAWSNAFYFLCLSVLSRLWPLRCFLLSSVLLLAGQGAFRSISGELPCVTPHSPVPPTSSTSINLSWQDWLPVSLLHEITLMEGRDRDIYFPELSSLLLPLWAFGDWRGRTTPLLFGVTGCLSYSFSLSMIPIP